MFKLILVVVLLGTVHMARSSYEVLEHRLVTENSTVAYQRAAEPTAICNSSSEGLTNYNPDTPSSIWICESSEWASYLLTPSIGSNENVSGQSCKHIKTHLSTAGHYAKSAVYWVQDMEVYCEMDDSLDGGGWTLVWQHSYMEDLPLNTTMTFFSDYYKPCTQYGTSWCNIPNKARFNPTEQMTVAYRYERVMYAYKGVFNRQIDYDWSGGVLIAYTKIIDKCSIYNMKSPQPVKDTIPGIAFSKLDYHNYYGTGGTITGSFAYPCDDRWQGCVRYGNQQMTVAIYVR